MPANLSEQCLVQDKHGTALDTRPHESRAQASEHTSNAFGFIYYLEAAHNAVRIECRCVKSWRGGARRRGRYEAFLC